MANAVIILAPQTLTSVSSFASGALAIVGALQQATVDINITAMSGSGATLRISRADQSGIQQPMILQSIPTTGPISVPIGGWVGIPFYDSIEVDILNEGNAVFSGTLSVTGRV